MCRDYGNPLLQSTKLGPIMQLHHLIGMYILCTKHAQWDKTICAVALSFLYWHEFVPWKLFLQTIQNTYSIESVSRSCRSIIIWIGPQCVLQFAISSPIVSSHIWAIRYPKWLLLNIYLRFCISTSALFTFEIWPSVVSLICKDTVFFEYRPKLIKLLFTLSRMNQ